MEQILTKTNNKVDAVVASMTALLVGAIAALAAQGLAGSAPVSGQDGDHAALNRIAPRHPDRVGLEGRARARQEKPPRSQRDSPTARK